MFQPKLELEEEEEFEDVDELFQPGWVKKEEPEEEEEGVTEKGLPRRNKWQTGVVAFAHDAYQVEPTKERISKPKEKQLFSMNLEEFLDGSFFLKFFVRLVRTKS